MKPCPFFVFFKGLRPPWCIPFFLRPMVYRVYIYIRTLFQGFPKRKWYTPWVFFRHLSTSGRAIDRERRGAIGGGVYSFFTCSPPPKLTKSPQNLSFPKDQRIYWPLCHFLNLFPALIFLSLLVWNKQSETHPPKKSKDFFLYAEPLKSGKKGKTLKKVPRKFLATNESEEIANKQASERKIRVCKLSFAQD